MAECRPKNYPKLKDYKPSRFMLPTCHYDKAKADRAVTFIENLRHTKGKWAGKRFWLLPWQEQIIRDVFGIVDEHGNRQFRTAYVEIGKKNGKSELAAAVALYLLFADNEPSAEVYGAAADRQQASIVFDVAHQMVQMTPALLKWCKIMAATKRIVNYGNAGFYQVLSAEVGTKHGLNVSGLVLDEVHAQPNRKLYDVLTKGSGDAREQPLFFLITTAGTDKESICYELHMKALDLLAGRKIDHTFYPVVYGLTDEDDWHDEANWYKANPSLGQTIKIERVRDAYQEALDTACITGLEDVVYVHVMFNSDLKRIVVRGCDENDKDALRWCIAKPDKRKSRKMSCKPFAELVYKEMDWDSECRYKVLGYRITFEGETLYVFDLLVPEIFHERQKRKEETGADQPADQETKPVDTRKGFYPDDIAGTFGIPVEEHFRESEVQQMDGYVSMGVLTGRAVPDTRLD